MLMAAGLEPPRRVAAHGWLLLSGEKISKSKLNQISPGEVVDEYGVDPVRYHFLRETPFGLDGDFSGEGLVARYNSDLANNLGNLLSRVATVVGSKCGGIGPAPRARQPAWPRPPPPPTRTRPRPGTGCAPSEALEATWRLIRETNAHLEAAEPWKSEPGPEVDAVLGDALEALRIVTILVSPAIPTASAEIWRRLGLPGSPADQRLPGAAAWGGYPGGLPVEKGPPALPPPQVGRRRCGPTATATCSTRPCRPTALDRAAAAGVGRVICIGTDAEQSAAAIAIARRHPDRVWATVGLHPHDAKNQVDGIVPLLDAPEVVAVGECGLDYHYDHSPRPVQREAFAAQIDLAAERGPGPGHPHPGGVGRHLRHPPGRRPPCPPCSTASRAGPAEARRASTSAPGCRSAGSSPSRPPATCGRRPPWPPSTASWWRPTPRI